MMDALFGGWHIPEGHDDSDLPALRTPTAPR